MFKSDTKQTLAFLQNQRDGGPWVLTAIHPENRNIETRTFTNLDEAGAWIEEKQGKWNLYFTVNPTHTALNSKAKKEDVAALAWLHVDIDPRVGEDFTREREIILNKLKAMNPTPTAIIDSGGGYQAFWKLNEAIPHTSANTGDLEAYNRYLADQLGGDHCHNIDRIMRLPGTINVPDAGKRKKGRTPRCAMLVEADWGRTYPIDVFQKAAQAAVSAPVSAEKVTLPETLPKVHLESLPLSEEIISLIWKGDRITQPYPSRSEALFAACCALVRAGCSDETIGAIILNPHLKISASVLDKPNPRAYAQRQIERARLFVDDPELAKLNEKHFIVSNYGGRCLVAELVYNPVLGREEWTFQSLSDFQQRYRNQFVEVASNDPKKPSIRVPLGKWWLDHANHRQYEQVVFAPEKRVPDNVFNLWTGFAVQPKPGNLHERYLAHVRDNICGGEEKYSTYLIRWMARAVQVPHKQGEIAIVLKGGKGVGKGQFAHHFGKLFGRHYVVVTDPRHLTGNFNSHLHDCVVLFADEVLASNKQQEGVMKALVTEPTLMLERKGLDCITASNFTHIIKASNESHVVNYTDDERRYFVLRVKSNQRRNQGYFKAITEDLEKGGYQNLLHFLQHVDLTNWDHTDAPMTDEAQNQLLESMSPVQAWLVDVLHRGVLPGDDLQKGNNPSLMCLKAAAEDLGMAPAALLQTLKRMGVLAGSQPIEKRVYRNPNGGVVKEKDCLPGAVAMGRRMYLFKPLDKLREAHAHYAPQGWERGDLMRWCLEEEASQNNPF